MQSFSTYAVLINSLLGAAMMLASARAGEFVAVPLSRRPQQAARAARLARVSIFSLGAAIATLAAVAYVTHLFHRSGT